MLCILKTTCTCTCRLAERITCCYSWSGIWFTELMMHELLLSTLNYLLIIIVTYGWSSWLTSILSRFRIILSICLLIYLSLSKRIGTFVEILRIHLLFHHLRLAPLNHQISTVILLLLAVRRHGSSWTICRSSINLVRQIWLHAFYLVDTLLILTR